MNAVQEAETAEQATLRRQLCALLFAGGHAPRSLIFACARSAKQSVRLVTPGYLLAATTLRGAPAWYLDWGGAPAGAAAQLEAYAATLVAAGWAAIPVAHWPDGRRGHYPACLPPPQGAAVGLLVAPATRAGWGEAGT